MYLKSPMWASWATPLPFSFLHTGPSSQLVNSTYSRTCTRWSQFSFCNISSKLDSSSKQVKVNEGEQNWILDNPGAIRSAPLYIGAAGVAAVLLNRFSSGIAPVADAYSAQSRADVLVIALSAAVILTGLVWKSIEPKRQPPAKLDGIQCMKVMSGLPAETEQEIVWVWEALAEATSAVSLIVVYGKNCVLQAGLAAESNQPGVPFLVDAPGLLQGSLCSSVLKSKKQMYLGNLALYPSRYELPFLPLNTQSVIVQPLSDEGVIIVGSDTVRGFERVEQGWIVAIAEKLDSSLADVNATLPSF